MPVKLDGGLFMSILRNKQFFYKLAQRKSIQTLSCILPCANHFTLRLSNFYLRGQFPIFFAPRIPIHGRRSTFFQKAGFEKSDQLFGFLNWRMPGTHGACVDKAQKAK
jgi:hypothetical protein